MNVSAEVSAVVVFYEDGPAIPIDTRNLAIKHGIFNLGFIGVRNTEEGRRFADWWAQRTQYLCRAEVANGLFTDQKWLNFAPVFFEGVAILKSPRHNVATWNLTTRRMSGDFEAGVWTLFGRHADRTGAPVALSGEPGLA